MSKQKAVNFEVLRGIYINGEKIMPGDKKPVVISIAETFANELAAAGKGKIVTTKANTAVKQKPAEDDLLAELGGVEGEDA